VGTDEATLALVHAPDYAGESDDTRGPIVSRPMNEDYRDILTALVAAHARFLVVGAHALAAHGYPRSTVDIDIWIDATDDNAQRVWRALAEFGAPLEDLSVSLQDLTRPAVVIQLGLPPNRIDILTGVSGLTFEAAWPNRVDDVLEGVRVPIIGLADLIENKRAAGRDKDRADVKGVEGRS